MDMKLPFWMRAGMGLIIAGVLALLAIGAIDFLRNSGDAGSSIKAALLAAVAAWACGAAATMYSSAKKEINKLKHRIAELEREKEQPVEITRR